MNLRTVLRTDCLFLLFCPVLFSTQHGFGTGAWAKVLSLGNGVLASAEQFGKDSRILSKASDRDT